MSFLALFLGFLAPSIVAAAPSSRAAGPSVTLGAATLQGITVGNVSEFLGIPYAEPPTGNLRFSLPVLKTSYSGTIDATAESLACPQQINPVPIPPGLDLPPAVIKVIQKYQDNNTLPASEDCLTLNVLVPSSATPSSKLPVVVWIYGGGFEGGGTTSYNGAPIVERSLVLGEPIIYVSMNYRVSTFGFLASQEVKDAGVGNLGLQDQRAAFRWVHNNIASFGGDPTKVTIWGESAGAISVALQLVTNGGNTEGLFRGAFMESGSPIPFGDITEGQQYYDAIVAQTGCSGSADTLQCLRGVPYQTLVDAMNASPGIFSYQGVANLVWRPRVDGVFLTDEAPNLVAAGSFANVPFVTGDCDDEGTFFSLATLNITTDAEFATYIATNDLPKVDNATINSLLAAYPNVPAQGSPFDTGSLNEFNPEWKRISAFHGDLVFNGPRRNVLAQRSSHQKAWSFLSKRLKYLPYFGSAHGTDILNVYGTGELQDYLINFVTNLNPNGKAPGVTFNWPQYTTLTKELLTFLDGPIPLTITLDTYRQTGISLITSLLTAYPN